MSVYATARRPCSDAGDELRNIGHWRSVVVRSALVGARILEDWMSIFGSIMSKIFGGSASAKAAAPHASEAPSVSAAAQGSGGPTARPAARPRPR